MSLQPLTQSNVLELHSTIEETENLLQLLTNYKGSMGICFRPHGNAQSKYFDVLLLFRDDVLNVAWDLPWNVPHLKEVEISIGAAFYGKYDELYGEFIRTSLWGCSSEVRIKRKKVTFLLDHTICNNDRMSKLFRTNDEHVIGVLESNQEMVRKLLGSVKTNGETVCVSRAMTLPGVYDEKFYVVTQAPYFVRELFGVISTFLEACRSEKRLECFLLSELKSSELLAAHGEGLNGEGVVYTAKPISPSK